MRVALVNALAQPIFALLFWSDARAHLAYWRFDYAAGARWHRVSGAALVALTWLGRANR